MSDIRKNLFLECSKLKSPSTDGGLAEVDVDIALIIESLILFDKYIIKSIGLEESLHLINLLGFEQFCFLLSSKILKFNCDLITVSVSGNSYGYYSFVGFSIPHEHRINMYLPNIINQLGYTGSKKRKLESVLRDNLEIHPISSSLNLLNQFIKDLENNLLSLKKSFAVIIKKELGVDIHYSRIKPDIIQVGVEKFKISTNIKSLIGINGIKEAEIIKKATVALANRNSMLQDVAQFKAMVGFRDDELELVEDKLKLIANTPDIPQNAFRKIINISGMPDFNQSILNKEIDVEKLLKIRESKECQEFRAWLWDINDKPINEIEEEVNNYNSAVSKYFNSTRFRALKYFGNSVVGGTIGSSLGTAIETLISGGVPILGPIAGAATGAVSSKAVESFTDYFQKKVLPENGPLFFINNQLPSIFI